jgi:hypothetical protein
MFGKLWWWPRSLMRTDQLLHMWTMRWALHALATDPWRLFDDPHCVARARATYLEAARHLDPACPVSVPVILAEATSRVSAHAVEALFCLDW